MKLRKQAISKAQAMDKIDSSEGRCQADLNYRCFEEMKNMASPSLLCTKIKNEGESGKYGLFRS